MTADLVLLIARLNLTLSIAIAAVLILRLPLRRWSGADLAYGLWTLVPVAGLADLVAIVLALTEPGPDSALFYQWPLPVLPGWALPLWVGGAIAGLLLMIVVHIAGWLQVRSGTAGPAVVGLLRPRLCLPSDFAERFTPDEQRLVRAHERVHLVRNDLLANALMGLVRCLLWFNPLVHIAAVAIRHDQELACDAEVMDIFPDQRRPYARAMLKAQLGPGGACAFGGHPLEHRIAAIVRGQPLPHPRVIGMVVIGLGCMALLSLYAASFGGGSVLIDLR